MRLQKETNDEKLYGKINAQIILRKQTSIKSFFSNTSEDLKLYKKSCALKSHKETPTM